MSAAIDIDHLQSWIGRTETASDTITPRLAESFRATLDLEPGAAAPGGEAPLCIHWCLAPAIVPGAATGPDGHPARGGFLPPVPLPRRMWAGGELQFLTPLRVGDRVTRTSRIESVELKEGRTGALCFVAVRHEIRSERGPAIDERQDLVYRGADAGPAAKPAVPEGRKPAEASREVEATTLLLFRYSALTFNGHRIHYDNDYCRTEENYPGLVVHGPLQATLLAHLAAERLGRAPAVFRYRGVSPLFDGGRFSVNAGADKAGSGAEASTELDLWTADAHGRTTMTAQASG
ncbi:MaoC family dehydratase N-terminal domain-containing protein [Aurantimonas sp. C2-6-R+9]|uniref:FAS1-like dehydratase domain-containing protein n=1 Tax=unclassified Aurantimonas TaxID=2638230 RepID=UPI002E181C05|nr:MULTISPECIES: MaoC family dehydratase N-terminal domain-containing protein [unclassified Aurantimonas]MEC5293461.1 MaoC family dehydratase N-terminal domain-containing protein [Aurantimonas sp. C2-3-R2]MEC5383675.1 MaoC family dehydratase N-terminal domain-containing protein [Aurantimonas sp. C2-6-R+9]MEC5414539.1 MaoC family dehydratase N-terminal domain-containing protein [Aurantimonas sp. C2-4-R8]